MSYEHEHVITFTPRPSLLEITRALNEVEKVFSQYTRVQISTNGSSDPELEEVYFRLESQ